MFDVLVYLYETYYRPDACPEPAALAKKLSAVGFDDVEISEALVWLNDLTEMAGVEHSLTAASTGTRFYVDEEVDVLGSQAVGFIQFLESAKVLSPLQREIVIERALVLDEAARTKTRRPACCTDLSAARRCHLAVAGWSQAAYHGRLDNNVTMTVLSSAS